ncbi:MAG: ATP-binding cassette domain-containing protein, partial [Finegoldia magna]|nr:ATP-binding cassette domain-containing protein [Finegoldia magna]
IDTNSLYKCVSYVEQENFIFNGTLKENIAFEDDMDNEINNCISLARIDDQSIKRDDFVILDDGYNLSSGQKQRISIARCFYKNSSLIILDEFTSNIDKEIENEILNNLKTMNLENKIVIIVSHRENPLKLCNKILNLNEKNNN